MEHMMATVVLLLSITATLARPGATSRPFALTATPLSRHWKTSAINGSQPVSSDMVWNLFILQTWEMNGAGHCLELSL